jgi:hypothetical protein
LQSKIKKLNIKWGIGKQYENLTYTVGK